MFWYIISFYFFFPFSLISSLHVDRQILFLLTEGCICPEDTPASLSLCLCGDGGETPGWVQGNWVLSAEGAPDGDLMPMGRMASGLSGEVVRGSAAFLLH